MFLKIWYRSGTKKINTFLDELFLCFLEFRKISFKSDTMVNSWIYYAEWFEYTVNVPKANGPVFLRKMIELSSP